MSRSYPDIPAEVGCDGYATVARKCFQMQKNKAQNAACPVCDSPTKGIGGGMADGKSFIRFYCGGVYRATVNREGQPVWAGRCGAKLVQKELAYE